MTECLHLVRKSMAQTELNKLGLPKIISWLNEFSDWTQAPSVLPHRRQESGRIAAKHLMSSEFKRFGYLGYHRDLDAKRQNEGFRSILESKGFNCTTHRFSRTSMEGNTIEWDNFRMGLLKWVETWSPPIGVLVSGDLYCRYLMEAGVIQLDYMFLKTSHLSELTTSLTSATHLRPRSLVSTWDLKKSDTGRRVYSIA